MDWARELHILTRAIRRAGAEALRMSRDGFEVHTKPDQSPVTSADLAVNRVLEVQLREAFPGDGWLSEESPDSDERLGKSRVWVVDPIDGTKAFIRREPEFCVSVALVEDGRPVVAAVYNPSTDELYSATRGGGLCLNESIVHPLDQRGHHHPVIALTPWEQHMGRFKMIEPHAASHPMRSIAWALALAAGGRLHAVATLESEHEWDVAAGTLLVEEAGGTAHDGAGHALCFNRPEPRYRGLIAMSRHCPSSVAQQLRTLSSC